MPPVTLVVGDWLVDEYWFLVQHDSETSSHAGTAHYRVANQIAEGAADLCGAGHVARVLVNLRDNVEQYKVCGVGDWHDSDTELLRHLLHPRPAAQEGPEIDCDAVRAWYWYKPTLCDSPPDVDLITLHPGSSTTRVIRQYHHEPTGLEQINRIDWEPDEKRDTPITDLSSLPDPAIVNRIVVQDFRKGVATTELVRALAQRYEAATWYVRSKDPAPAWLNIVKARLELLVLGPEVATRGNPWKTLLVNRTPSDATLTSISALDTKFTVLVSERLEVVAVSSDGICITGQSYLPTPPTLNVRWLSVLFGALIHFLSETEERDQTLAKALEIADKYGSLNVPRAFEFPIALYRQPHVTPTSAIDEAALWRASRDYTACGVLSLQSGEELHVWRATPCIPDYIAIIGKKQDALTEIGKVLREFSDGKTRRSVSVLLQADPGSGKTFLARALATYFGFAFIQADISQMAHRDELFALFDDIATQQANSRARVFVFIDEFNSPLDGGNVYGAFLSPLEEGVFLSHGKRFSLRPCAWMFAGTTASPKQTVAAEKLADLNSRLTLKVRIDYEHLEQEMVREHGDPGRTEFQREAALEQVYLAAAMIHSHYPDVHAVAYQVLEFFRDLKADKDDETGAAPRRVRRYVEGMRGFGTAASRPITVRG